MEKTVMKFFFIYKKSTLFNTSMNLTHPNNLFHISNIFL